MGKAKPVASIPLLRLWRTFRFRLRSIFGHLGFGGGLDIVGRKVKGGIPVCDPHRGAV